MKFFNQKKGMIGWSALISVILGLVVIGAVVTGVIGPGVGFAKKKFFDEESSEWMFPWREQEFQPYNQQYSREETLADLSMKSLVEAINAMAEGRSVLKKDLGIPTSSNVKSYSVKYYITYEFDNRFIELDHIKEISVTKEKDEFKNPDEFWLHVFNSISEAKNSNVKHIKAVHNMQLDVEYYGGNKCSIDTSEGKRKYSGNTLNSWGGKSPLTGKLRDGPDKDQEPDEGCSDSITWLQCPNIKAYYCGRKGSKKYEGEFNSLIYWESNGKSKSKVKTLIEFNNEQIKSKSVGRYSIFELLASIVARGAEIVSDKVDKVPILGNLNPFSFGKGNYERTRAYCYGGEKIKTSKGLETDIIVKCEEDGLICYVCNFYLPQEVTDFEYWITGFGDPQYLAYYESFPEGQDIYWEFATLKTAGYIGMSMGFVGTINFITSKMGVKVSRKQATEIVEEGVEQFAKKFGKEALEKGFKETSEETLEILSTKAGKKGVESFVKSGLFKNSLDELPEIGLKRSRYLSDVFEQYLKEAAEQYTKKGVFKTSSSIAKEIEEIASERFIREMPDIMSPSKLKEFEYSSQLFNSLKLTDDLGVEVTGDTAKKVLTEQVSKNLGETLGQKITKETMVDFMIERSTINTFKNLLEESGEAFSEKAMRDVLEQAVELTTAINKLPRSYQKLIYDRTNKRVATLFTERGFLKHGVMKRSSTEFFGDKIDDVIVKMPDSKLEFIAGQLKAIYGTSKSGLEVLPTSGWVDGPALPIALGKKYLLTFGVSINPITQTKHLSRFVYGKRYTLLFAVALLAEYQDTVDDKTAPGGVNSLLLGAPSELVGEKKKEYPLASAAKKFYIALHERYKGQHTFRENIETTRFYLASPCKTDLVLKVQNCNCMRRPENLHYNFGGGPIDVKKGTMFIKPEATEEEAGKIINILESNQYYPTSPLNDANFLSTYSTEVKLIEDEKAVKICEDRGLWESIKSTFGNKEAENYKTKCISVEPFVLQLENQTSNYCYPRFPMSENVKSYVSSAVIITEVVLEVVTLGAATPVIVAMNVGDVALSGIITELWQKWPRSEQEDG